MEHAHLGLVVSTRVLCKFFAQGACLKGEHCEFSHDWKDQANNICTYYQKGVCSYGSRCRYEHVKVSRRPASASSSSSSSSRPHIVPGLVQVTRPSSLSLSGEFKPAFSSPTEQSTLSRSMCPPSESAWMQKHEAHTLPDSMVDHYPSFVSLADQPICSFAAAGSCPHGERCRHIHGDLCSICGKHCLHPYRPDEREEHIKTCQQNNKRLEALRRSQEIECSVCLDRVLSKPTAAERKFGLLSECDHPFCVSCIRNWRSNSPASGMDVNSALRACPICRKLSYFVIPSVIWYSTQEEKQEIVNSYKDRLKSIDCKYFDFGSGTCPFGTSCFYRHTYKPDRNRPRPRSYRPRRYWPRQVFIEEEELMELAAQLAIDDKLENLDDEDADGLLGMAFMLMHLGIGESSAMRIINTINAIFIPSAIMASILFPFQ